MRRYWQILTNGQRQFTGSRAGWWLSGLAVVLLVKVVGVTIGGWPTLLGLGLLSLWLPLLVTSKGSRRSFWLIWGLEGLLALVWLPFGLGGLTATLQTGIVLPAPVQNVIFNTRYQWGPIVGAVWGLIWLASFKWLPSSWHQLRQPTNWRQWWLAGWHQSFWQVVGRLLGLVRWLFCWAITAGLVVGFMFVVERLVPGIGKVAAAIGLAGLLWTLLLLVVAGLATGLPPLPVHRSQRWWTVSLSMGGCLLFAGWWLAGTVTTAPAVIAHRGVDGHNGVQNTTGTLKRTVKATRPALVEMDIQPTLDHHWVVMHDPTLSHLSQRKGPVRDYRLHQLIGLPLWENGAKGQLSTFNQYLKAADQLKQPLLVEIKSIGSAANLMTAFDKQYAGQLQRQHHLVHSLDYDVVLRLKQHDAKLRVGYITPFNLAGFSANAADFYSLQALTLTREQLGAAQRQHKAVYCWTPDGAFLQQRLAALGVTGIITNQPGQLRQLMHPRHNVYTFQLINWVFNLL